MNFKILCFFVQGCRSGVEGEGAKPSLAVTKHHLWGQTRAKQQKSSKHLKSGKGRAGPLAPLPASYSPDVAFY